MTEERSKAILGRKGKDVCKIVLEHDPLPLQALHAVRVKTFYKRMFYKPNSKFTRRAILFS